ncbi:GntR family transcriptional regulator [Spiroplasma corruscae]|uniref:GntR family transcriptional regulator n=1 Tax=Spiroplasma corruscae TaxID=216934 RepID=A0A222EP35_9MOLU|nr:MurR/RpiR family transcriptional regulator [Spiroplasma corruscae]ASP28286.1 GntR family transcriptional regulator [Spiroplasma corruscae]
MIKNIFNQINQIAKHSENISFKVIAEFIVNNFESLDNYTIFDVSKLTNTSASTITRFCKKIGLTGYKSLYWTIQTHKKIVEEQNETPYEEVQCKLTNLINNTVNSAASYSKNRIEKIVNLIYKAKNVYLFGEGNDSFLIELFINWVIKINLKTFYVPDIICQKSYAEIMRNDDIAIVISYSLNNPDYQSMIEKLNAKNINIITITNNDNSQLIKNKNLILKLPLNESINKTNEESYFSVLYYLRIIYYKLIELNKNNFSIDKLCIN